ncbi:MAG TPA: metallophosphoesterase [Burkholderiales bacterium]|nr:metallophosphoesterase [Burkholderiales bacterium]
MRFALVVTALLGASYSYVAWRLAPNAAWALALAVPFLLIWIVPVVYWGSERGRETLIDHLVHRASYLSMAWVSFILVLTLALDLVLLLTWGNPTVRMAGVPVVLAGSVAAVAIGAAAAFRGPHIRRVDIPFAGLHPDLDGLRIVQISDLHVGPNIGRRYVERVVELSQSLDPDMVVLTGDIVDGPVGRLAGDVAPLANLRNAHFILGNHDCYAGADVWMQHFREMGMTVLANSNVIFRKGNARLLVGGMVDPAYGRLRPEISVTEEADFKLLLAHNPRLAPRGEKAGFDLQLSGHTHGGQFFPWTLAVRLVHAPHVWGLSQEGAMKVYVSAGTGTWGPPVRFGTSPELTLIRLVKR